MARNILLVHGAWQGSWSFNKWVPILENYKWNVCTVDLPGNGWGVHASAPASLDSYVLAVAEIMRDIGEPVVLIGHSGGGITISQVAEMYPDQVSVLVYLAGMMLPTGMNFSTLIRHAEREADIEEGRFTGIGPYLEWNESYTVSKVCPEGALSCFFSDCDSGDAERAIKFLTPQSESGRNMCNKLSLENFGSIPRIYVECLNDCSVFPRLQRLMQKLVPGAIRLTLESGHVPQLSCPEKLTELLIPMLNDYISDI